MFSASLQVGFKATGRRCTRMGCNGILADHILDWEDALPPKELKATQQHASDVVRGAGGWWGGVGAWVGRMGGVQGTENGVGWMGGWGGCWGGGGVERCCRWGEGLWGWENPSLSYCIVVVYCGQL